MRHSKLWCVPGLTEHQADTKAVMITAPDFTARQKAEGFMLLAQMACQKEIWRRLP